MIFLLKLLALYVFAAIGMFGAWKLGQWLRSKGYGAQLNKLEKGYDKIQGYLHPNLNSFTATTGAFNRLPLLGNKQKVHMEKEHD